MQRRSLVVIVLLAAISKSSGKEPDCDELGFSNFVLCSDCTELHSFVRDEALFAECNRCCTPDDSKEEATFTEATLEFCPLSIR